MTSHIKRSTSKAALLERKHRFVEEYIANGGNGTRAAMTLGYPEKSARTRASEMVADHYVSELIKKRQEELRGQYRLNTENVIREISRISFYDPRKLVGKDGIPKKLDELDDDTAAALAAIEIEVGEGGQVSYRTRPHSKTTALEQACKILRLFDVPLAESGAHVQRDIKETAKWLAFMLARGDKQMAIAGPDSK